MTMFKAGHWPLMLAAFCLLAQTALGSKELLDETGYPICLVCRDCSSQKGSDAAVRQHPALIQPDGWSARGAERSWTGGNESLLPITGTYRIPVIVFGYANVPQPAGVMDHLHQKLTAEFPANSLSAYYSVMSNGRFRVIPELFQIDSLPGIDTDYEGDEMEVRIRLLNDIMQSVDHLVDFRNYDNDGPDGIPDSGDDDGYIDTLMLVFPECANKDLGNIWPVAHSATWFNDGDGIATADESHDGQPIRIGKYSLQTTVDCDGGLVDRNRVFKHEFGHCLGLPDLYDLDSHEANDDDPWAGLGDYCLMAKGEGLSAWCKYRLGWVEAQSLNGLDEELVEFPRTADTQTVWKIDLNRLGSEYFLIEHRGQDDTYESLFGFGLLIYHVDETRSVNTRPDCTGLSQSNHPKVTLEQADGACDLENGLPNSSFMDFWRQDVADRFAFDTMPHSLSYTGFDLGIEIREISSAWNPVMTATVTAGDPPFVAVPGPLEVVWMFDLSSSYEDDLVHMRDQITGAIDDIEERYPNSRHAIVSFVDFPILPWGEPFVDYPFKVHTDFVQNPEFVKQIIDELDVLVGLDVPESQYEAIFQVLTGLGQDWNGDGEYSPELGDIEPYQFTWSDDHKAVLIMMTDAEFHDGFSNMEYPYDHPVIGTGELQVSQALRNLDFYPTTCAETPSIFVLDAQNPFSIGYEIYEDGIGGYPGSGTLLHEQAMELAFLSSGAYIRAGENTARFREAVREVLGRLSVSVPMRGICVLSPQESGDPICSIDQYQQDCEAMGGYFIPNVESCTNDCNGDGVIDVWEIIQGDLVLSDVDVNDNGVLDSCECLGDLDYDNDIDIDDLLKIVSYWGECTGADPCPGDFDRNWWIDIEDLLLVLSRWGTCQDCATDEITDCNGHCAPELWLGDGTCDDGQFDYNGFPIDFNCSEFGFDGGDCADCSESEIPDCNGHCAPATWLGDGTCDDGQFEYNGAIIDFNCESLEYDGGDCLP